MNTKQIYIKAGFWTVTKRPYKDWLNLSDLVSTGGGVTSILPGLGITVDNSTGDVTISGDPDSVNPVENEYVDTAAMQADQVNQTDTFFQYVSGADEYYEYLGTTTGILLTDYRLLSDTEVEIINNSQGFKAFRVQAIQDNTVPVTSVGNGRVKFEYDTDEEVVSGIIFNRQFSSIISNYVNLEGSVDFYISLYNRNRRKYHIARVVGFDTVGTDFIKLELDIGEDAIIDPNAFSINNRVEFNFDVDNGGGSGTLAQTLTAGNDTGGTDIHLNDSNITMTGDDNGNISRLNGTEGVDGWKTIVSSTGDAPELGLRITQWLASSQIGVSNIEMTPGLINIYSTNNTDTGAMIIRAQISLRDYNNSAYMSVTGSLADDDLIIVLGDPDENNNETKLIIDEQNELIDLNAGHVKVGRIFAVGDLSGAEASERAFVSDANATTFYSVVVGGGSNFVPVFFDGTNWRIG